MLTRSRFLLIIVSSYTDADQTVQRQVRVMSQQIFVKVIT